MSTTTETTTPEIATHSNSDFDAALPSVDSSTGRNRFWLSTWAVKLACWAAASAIVLLYMGYVMIADRSPSKALLLPGTTTHGHYQIELACDACHTPMMGVKQEACNECHAAELKAANDTHPAKKFNDPTNAERLEQLNAKKCITCHREHVPEQTHPMGLSLPTDYCFHCHQDVKEQRPSHEKFTYESCATAGCHNYHDNTALYENFLVQHWEEPKVLEPAVLQLSLDVAIPSGKTLRASEQDAPLELATAKELVDQWASSAHAKAGVNCSGCHEGSTQETWQATATHETCAKCHEDETDGFLSGRHGMRLAQQLSPMMPSLARLPMKQTASHLELSCSACHSEHDYDTRKAAVDACLKCHNDSHSRAYLDSSHYQLWQSELSGEGVVGSGVSCATCHLPRVESDSGEVVVQHNQNDNLRPNEKMVRSVCNQCHGVGFALDALADRELIERCFDGEPSAHIKSLDMAKAWFDAKASKRKQRLDDTK